MLNSGYHKWIHFEMLTLLLPKQPKILGNRQQVVRVTVDGPKEKKT